MAHVGTLLRKPPSTRINTFGRDGNDIVKVGQVAFDLGEKDIVYNSRNINAPAHEAKRYWNEFYRDLDSDALYVSEQIANSLRYASELKIYNLKDPIRSINVYIGNLNTWRDRVYGSEISSVAAFVYRGSLHIRPNCIFSWNIVQHETGHIIQLHNRRELGRNNYPTPQIREGAAELFRMAFGAQGVEDETGRIQRVLERYAKRLGREGNDVYIDPYRYRLLSDSDNEWIRNMECHKAGDLIGLVALSVNRFDIDRTVRDLFSVSDLGELSLLLRNRSAENELVMLARSR